MTEDDAGADPEAASNGTPLLLQATGRHVGEAGPEETTVSDAAGQQEP